MGLTVTFSGERCDKRALSAWNKGFVVTEDRLEHKARLMLKFAITVHLIVTPLAYIHVSRLFVFAFSFFFLWVD